MFVFIVALAHAIFPLLGGSMLGKTGVVIGTIVEIFVAIFIGGSAYSVIDVIGVVVGAVLGFLIF